MQNKTLSFLGSLLLSVTFTGVPAFAQETLPDVPAPAAVQPAPQAQPENVISQRAEDTKKLLAQTLAQSDTDTTDKQMVNFPGRSDLSSLELATLPGTNETNITGPAPMEKSISKRDLPSEQLLGRVTTEVFQEMADIERGNTFLKLQMQKENLRNDLEKLKATYRQSRLEEINKRESIIKDRIKWWQEQEEKRMALEKKKAEELLLEQKILDAEATRERLRAEAMERIKNQRAAAEKAAKQETKADKSAAPASEMPVIQPTTQDFKTLDSLYVLTSVKGTRGKLTAVLKDQKGTTLSVKKGDTLPSGHVVTHLSKDKIETSFNGIDDALALVPVNN